MPLSVSSIESGGVVNNSLRLSVSYRAATHHTTGWFIIYQNRDMYKTGKDNTDACYAPTYTHSRREGNNAFGSDVRVSVRVAFA